MIRSRFWIALLCIVLFLCVVPPVTASAVAVTPEHTYSAAVHLSASSDARVIGYMEDGKTVTVLKETKAFYQIDCYDMTGYIAKTQVVRKNDGKYYVNCDKTSPETRKTETLSQEQAAQLQSAILALGKRYLGVPYVHGGMSPKGFDCSGFTSYIYSKNGYSLHRVDCDQLQDGFIIAKEEMQAGDLVFFRKGNCVTSHVGIYAGDGKVLHASTRGISLNDLDDDYYSRYYLCARRVVCAASTGIDREAVVGAASAAAYAKTAAAGRRFQTLALYGYL